MSVSNTTKIRRKFRKMVHHHPVGNKKNLIVADDGTKIYIDTDMYINYTRMCERAKDMGFNVQLFSDSTICVMDKDSKYIAGNKREGVGILSAAKIVGRYYSYRNFLQGERGNIE